MSNITAERVLQALNATGAFRVRRSVPRDEVRLWTSIDGVHSTLWRVTVKGTLELINQTWLQRWIYEHVSAQAPANVAAIVLASELSRFPPLTEKDVGLFGNAANDTGDALGDARNSDLA